LKPIVIIPTYNEMDSLPPLVERIRGLGAGVTMLIVDDASPDGTGSWAEECARLSPGEIAVIRRAGKLGLGTAHLAGMHRGLDEGFDPILTMDADLSHPPETIPAMLRLIASGRADLVIGSRYVPGGGTKNWPTSRILLSRGANLFARTLLGLGPHDATAGFRCYAAPLLRRVPLDSVRAEGYSFLVEMLFLAKRAGARALEVPITFEDRRFGVSKISRSEILKAILTVLRLARA
jgi:glycosyltransferase involved in cell wall biosynthesis